MRSHKTLLERCCHFIIAGCRWIADAFALLDRWLAGTDERDRRCLNVSQVRLSTKDGLILRKLKFGPDLKRRQLPSFLMGWKPI